VLPSAEAVVSAEAAASAVLKARPEQVSFGTRPVGSHTLKGTKVTNTSSARVQVLVQGGLPDDFSFGLLPGSTCPVFSPGEIFVPGQSCEAVVDFHPSEFFAGQEQVATLTALAYDVDTGLLLDTQLITFTGRGH